MDERELWVAQQRAFDLVFKSSVDFYSLKAALELNLFNILASGPHDLADLAQATESVPQRLEKFLIVLEQIGLLRRAGEQWALTVLAERFFTDPPPDSNHTMIPFADYTTRLAEDYHMRLADVVRGKMDFPAAVPYPPRTKADSQFYETLHRSNLHFVIKLLCERACLGETRHLIDVGGGNGDIAAALCKQFPDLQVTLLNLPSALEIVRENVAAQGLSDRIEPVAVDMYREPLPAGDAVLFSRILYPMNAEICSMLCHKAFAALQPGGQLLILDMDIGTAGDPNYDFLSHYLSGVGTDFSLLEVKSHQIYPELLCAIGFDNVAFDAAHGNILYQAIRPAK